MAFLEGGKEIDQPGYGVDFHMHTTASDGAWSPEKLVNVALARGVRVMTVTDHDTIKSVGAVSELARAKNIQFISGVEITVSWKGTMYHMLLFNFDPSNFELQAMLADTQRQLLSKSDYIIEELKKIGYKLDALHYYKRPGDEFMAINIAKALYRGGETRTFDQAVSLCLGLGMAATFSSQQAEKAIEIGIAAGGIPVLAHPNRLEKGFTIPSDKTLHELAEAGLAGIEAYHPSHKVEDVHRLLNFAKTNKLIVSCGSDSHGEARKPTPWNPELCRELLERLNIPVP